MNTINVNFSEFHPNQEFIQTVANAAAQSNSGVRAQWTELPDCSRWCNFLDAATGKPNLDAPLDGQPAGDFIPLRDDLANAIIATCKGPEPAPGPTAWPPPTPETPPSGWVANSASTIYDPVWKTSTLIPDHEHQVQGAGVHDPTAGDDHQKTIINQTQQVVGPKGDFYTHWNWAHQSKDASWDTAGPGGVNYSSPEMTSETSHGWNPS